MPFAVAGVPGVFATEADAQAAINAANEPPKTEKKLAPKAESKDDEGGEA
jgi:hypothetical protein